MKNKTHEINHSSHFRVKKLIHFLKPYGKVARSLAVLVAAWALVCYVTVCFGAPALTHWRETGSFSALIVVLAVLPTVAVLGAESKSLAHVYLDSDVTADTDPIAHLLFRFEFGSVLILLLVTTSHPACLKNSRNLNLALYIW